MRARLAERCRRHDRRCSRSKKAGRHVGWPLRVSERGNDDDPASVLAVAWLRMAILLALPAIFAGRVHVRSPA
ncbi:hypothetical protein [Solimonas soli]|uniref:hypothetical protein n=1 Tax=Solimonas soli TaxID=413479 RepID=UPI0012FC6044|nr:hypothetical protein [Solimonas soli]